MRNACYVKIRIALATNNTPADPDEFASFIDGLEARRFDTVWLSDTPMAPVIEPKLALAMASARTTRLKLGTNVVVAGRNPMLLAKELAHLDRLTHGRLLLAFMPGIGSPKERAALGTIGMDRTTRIEQTIELCRAWWAVTFLPASGASHRRGRRLELRRHQGWPATGPRPARDLAWWQWASGLATHRHPRRRLAWLAGNPSRGELTCCNHHGGRHRGRPIN